MSTITSILIIQLILALSFSIVPTQQRANNRPIIGVLTQEVSEYLNRKYPGHHSYIAASYVKFIEGAGARVVPIWIGKNQSYYEDIMSKINGVLWPGGAASFDYKNGYADAGYKIYNIAKQKNKGGDHFPIFAICLGFELLTYVTANRNRHILRTCSAEKIALNLEFEPDYKSSKLFRNASAHIKEILATKDVTLNSHQYCVTKQALKTAGIKNKFRVLSLNHDENGLEFISSLESVKYPFYGLQFHPEKNLYEWVIGEYIPHSKNAVQISQYFANFFVNEASNNSQVYPSTSEESQDLIYNYETVYTGVGGLDYQQIYFFDKKQGKRARRTRAL